MSRHLIVLLLFSTLVGCVDTAVKPEAATATVGKNILQLRRSRENAMQDQWIGKSLDQVVASLGEPVMIMTIPGTASSSAVVYGIRDMESRCIDAFRVAHGSDPVVTNYFCR